MNHRKAQCAAAPTQSETQRPSTILGPLSPRDKGSLAEAVTSPDVCNNLNRGRENTRPSWRHTSLTSTKTSNMHTHTRNCRRRPPPSHCHTTPASPQPLQCPNQEAHEERGHLPGATKSGATTGWNVRGTELDSLLGFVPLQPSSAGLLGAWIGGDVEGACCRLVAKRVVREPCQLIVCQVPACVKPFGEYGHQSLAAAVGACGNKDSNHTYT